MERKDKTASPESLPQRMERLAGGSGKRKVHEAEDLVFDSWEAADCDEEFELLTKAVELDSRNVDAWLGLMRFVPLDGNEEIEFLRRLVALGEKNLGKKLFRECKGIFWGLLETRPYMRARSRLAFRLMEARRLEESVTEHEGMLELCPNDNLGVRYGLMALYLALNNLDGATASSGSTTSGSTPRYSPGRSYSNAIWRAILGARPKRSRRLGNRTSTPKPIFPRSGDCRRKCRAHTAWEAQRRP